jgi:hypothetical protein
MLRDYHENVEQVVAEYVETEYCENVEQVVAEYVAAGVESSM